MTHRLGWSLGICCLLVCSAFAHEPHRYREFTSASLRQSSWTISVVEGAEGELAFVDRDDYAVRVQKQNETGDLLFLNTHDIAIAPGTSYHIRAYVRASEGSPSPYLMASIPGGKRHPYAASSPKEQTDSSPLELRVHARADEQNLHIHVVVPDKGTVEIDRITVEAVPSAEPADLVWGAASGGAPLDRWQVDNAVQTLAMDSDRIEATVVQGTTFKNMNLAWETERIQAVEIGWRAEEEPGFLRMHWTARDGDESVSGSLATTYLADRQWRSLLFDVSDHPDWRGVVQSIQFEVQSNRNPARAALAYVHGLPRANLIPNASRTFRTPSSERLLGPWERQDQGWATVPVRRIRPNTVYRLAWPADDEPAEAELQLQDHQYEQLLTIQLPGDRRESEFRTPPETAMATLRLRGPRSRTAPPTLEVVEPAALPGPEPWWTGQWIWSRRGSGPTGSVWFEREFELDSRPRLATLLMTADNAFELWINGERFEGGANWTEPEQIDVASALRSGENRIVVRVDVHSGWGGLLGELFVELDDGRDGWIRTDSAWTCLEAEREQPPDRDAIAESVVVLGRPPVEPWGTHVAYRYTGPSAPVSVRDTSVASKVSEADQLALNVELDLHRELSMASDRWMIALRNEDQIVRRLPVQVTARSEDWPARGQHAVDLTFPKRFWTGLDTLSFEIGLAQPGVHEAGTEAEFVSLLEVDVPPPAPAPPFTRATVEGAGQRAHIRIGGQAYPPIAYYTPHAFTEAPEKHRHLIRDIADRGGQIYRLSDYFSSVWQGPGEYDFASLDRAVEMILAEDPSAWIMLNYDVRAPEWWLEQHPDQAMQYHASPARSPQHDFQSMASDRWLDDVSSGLRAMIRHIREQPYSSRIIGFSPNAGQTSEWIWDMGMGHDARHYSGYSPAGIEGFRQWLRERYEGDTQALQQAWEDPSLGFDTAEPPLPEERSASDFVTFLDPPTRRPLMDYWSFRNERTTANILSLCQTIKDETDGRWLTGTYYGYTVMFSRIYAALQEAGHLGLDRLLASVDVDFLLSPTVYPWRNAGLANGTMQPTDTLSLNGKLLLAEFDTRTFTEPRDMQWPNGRVQTVEETLGVLDRDFGMMVTRGMGFYWMEMYGLWFREPVVLDALQRQMKAYVNLPEQVHGHTPVEVCVVSDLRSPLYVRLHEGDGIHTWLIAELLRRMDEAGFAYRHVLLDDVLKDDHLPPHKLYILTNTLVLNEQERERLHQRFAEEEADVLWLYAPGAFTPESEADAANVEATLGMTVDLIAEKRPMQIQLPDEWGGGTAATRTATGPWFVVQDDDTQVIVADEQGRPMMVRQLQGAQATWFSTIPNLPPTVLRRIAEEAGAWIYADGEDPLHIGNDLIFLHAKTGGSKQLTVPSDMALLPVLGPQADSLQSGEPWEAKAGRTYGFRLIPETE